MAWHLDHFLRAALALILSFVLSTLMPAGVLAQSNEDPVSQFEGRYQGKMVRGPQGLIGGWPTPASRADAMRKDKRVLSKPAEDNERKALEFSGNAGSLIQPPFPVRLSILPVGDHWTVELQYSDDPGDIPVPLPNTVVLNIEKAQTPSSPVKLDHFPPGVWMAWAFPGRQSLTISLVELKSAPDPIQFQIVLHHMNESVVLILWRIDWTGHQSTSWSSVLKRE
jgi:hypothetical protein